MWLCRGEKAMSIARLGTVGRLTAGVSAMGGALSILSLVLRLHPTLENVKYLKEVIELYALYIRAPLTEGIAALLPANDMWLASALGDGVVFWMTFFMAVNAFIYRNDGQLLPGHILDNYCQFASAKKMSRFMCLLPKLIIAFLAAPIVCSALAILKIGSSPNRLYSIAYMTIQPKSIVAYILAMFVVVAGVMAFAEFLLAS